jgi:hypothetical protein
MTTAGYQSVFTGCSALFASHPIGAAQPTETDRIRSPDVHGIFERPARGNVCDVPAN